MCDFGEHSLVYVVVKSCTCGTIAAGDKESSLETASRLIRDQCLGHIK